MEEKEKNEKGLQKVNNQPPYPYPPPYYTPCEEDEIDIYELWLILKRRKKWIFYTVGVFLLFAFLYLLVTKPKYRTVVVYQSVSTVSIDNSSTSKISAPTISTDVLAQAINNLNNALQQENYKFLTKNLNLPPSEVEKITSISAQKDKKSSAGTLKVIISTSDKGLIPILCSKIENYLNKLPVVQNVIKSLKQYLKTKIKVDTEQIVELENLKRELLEKLGSIKDPNFKNLVLNKISDIDTQILNKKAEIEFAKLQLKQLKGVELAVPPVIPDKPYSPKKGLVITVAAVGGLIFGIFLAFFVEWLENAKKEYEQKEKKGRRKF